MHPNLAATSPTHICTDAWQEDYRSADVVEITIGANLSLPGARPAGRGSRRMSGGGDLPEGAACGTEASTPAMMPEGATRYRPTRPDAHGVPPTGAHPVGGTRERIRAASGGSPMPAGTTRADQAANARHAALPAREHGA
jgi:hypothetical protein